MLIWSALIVWALALLLAGWWLTHAMVTEAAPEPPPPPDPVEALVDKWAHDWERGRA